MEPEYWRRVKSIFQAALAVEQPSREGIVQQSCAGDERLAAEVRALLGAHEESGTFLETPATSQVAARRTVEAALPERLGPWKVLGGIGRGGMADVYLVERCDGHFEKRAALKVLRAGLFGDDVRTHFARERQVLADLDHPYIVRLLDGGVTEDHRPYLVMDFVDGVRITEYASSLSRTERIELFLRVCEAVGYAHEHGVVHRDLKPANILVIAGGEPRVLDFGIAKLLPTEPSGAAESGSTQTHCFTMEYASPEQVRGEPATQASDVHALGLVFYEILLDRRPFEVGSRPMYEAARVVCEQSPDVADLPQGLARIVGKALRKDPAQRYASVREFAAAIGQYLVAPGRQWRAGRRVRQALIAAASLAVVGAVVTWVGRHQRATASSVFSAELTRLTSYPGTEEHPSLSPSGRKVAFSRSDVRGIWIRTIESGAAFQLTDGPDCCAGWSPDSDTIAFGREVGNGLRDVLLVGEQGGPVRKVARVEGTNFSWTRDRTAIAVEDRASADQPFSIDLVSVSTGARRRLTQPSAGAWGDLNCAVSPDGKSLAFIRYVSRGNGDVYIVPLAGGEPRRVTSIGYWINGVAWTSDSKEILFPTTLASAGNKSGLWRIPATATPSTKPILVRGVEGTFSGLSVALRPPDSVWAPLMPAGTRIVLQADVWDSNILKMRLAPAPGLPTRVLAEACGEETPAFSPDGKRLAFYSNCNGGDHEIWTAGADGSNRTRITSTRTLVSRRPSWSPDGSLIAYRASREGHSSIYVVPSGGGPSRPLPTEGDAGAPTWSRDGRWIYFRCVLFGAPQICKSRPDGSGVPVQVTHTGAVEAFESADGTALYFLRSQDLGTLRWMPAGGGSERDVAGAPPMKSGAWTVTGRGIYFLDTREEKAGHTPVKLFLPRTQEVMVVGVIPYSLRPFVEGISVSPDRNEIAWTLIENSADLVMIDNFR